MSNSRISDIVQKLYPFQYAVIGKGNDEAIPYYLSELDFTIHEFKEEQELNGWTIPKSEIISTAKISKDNKVIYDGLENPLGMALLSQPFKGKIELSELKKHLFFHDQNSEILPFHCTQQYRPGEKTWGFCVPQTFYDSLEEGEYYVDIRVEPYPTTMKVLDFVIPGTSQETIVFQAHNCHPFQANDDISGCAVGIKLFQDLLEKGKHRFTYRLLICPELTGTLFWLNKIKQTESARIAAAIIMPAVANNADLKLQESFTGETFLDRAAHRVFKKKYGLYKSGGFRRIYGNDETVFEAPGYNIPSISITRYPFPEYHSNLDTPEICIEEKMQDTLDCLQQIITDLESGIRLEFTGNGLFCLSHPRYDLYKRVWDPSSREGPKTREDGRQWNLFMTELPRKLDGQVTLLDLAEEYGLPYQDVREYCMKWVERGLAKKV